MRKYVIFLIILLFFGIQKVEAKTIDVNTYERNKEAADSEFKYVFKCRNIGKICLFTTEGQMHTIKAMDLPLGKFRDKGIPIDNVSNFSSEKEEIVYITSQTQINLSRLVFVTSQAMMKRQKWFRISTVQPS